MANKVRFGLSKCYYSIYNESTGVWAAPVAMPYAQSLSIDRNKTSENVYADNQLIHHIDTLNSISMSLQMSVIEDSVKQAILGHKADSVNSNNVEITNATKVYFALLFQVEGDSENRRKIFFKCTASLGSENYQSTGESTNPVSETLEITAYPVTSGNYSVLDQDADAADGNYATFFTNAPTLPNIV